MGVGEPTVIVLYFTKRRVYKTTQGELARRVQEQKDRGVVMTCSSKGGTG